MATDVSTADTIALATGRIKGLCKKSAQSIIEIGKELIEVKGLLSHGKFGDWLDKEFGWDLRSAQRMMGVAQKFKSDNLSHFGTSALYLLASDSVPAAAVEEAMERADAGEPITHAKAKEIVAKHKPQPEPVEEYESDADAEDDAEEVEKVLRGEYKEQHKERTVKNEQEILTEKIAKLVDLIECMASERMGNNAKSRAVIEHLQATIPLIKSMYRSWRNI